MVPEALRSIPEGSVDVTSPVTIDGLSYVDPTDPAMPMYRLLANLRSPVALRDLMIRPVRTGYIGEGYTPPDPSMVPESGAEAEPDVDVSQVYLPIDGGVARCQLYRPRSVDAEEQLPVIVYLHGGGFTVGSSEDCDFLTRKLARTNRALVVSANYRMAPEFPFPTPFDDAMGVYRWVADHAALLGGGAGPVVVAGDSAGSNLAAAMPLRARDEGVRVPDAVVLLGAMTDFRFERWPSFQAMAPRGIVYDSAFAGFLRGAYVPTTAWDHPWVSPIEGDLADYPLTVIATGTHDPMIDSSKTFAQRVEGEGGRVVTYFPEGMPHGFYFFPKVHPEEDVAYTTVRGALASLLATV
jgi:acetyl esterase